jgi:hypothetical protein
MLPQQLRQFLPGSGVGFSADWVSRNQGGEQNLGSIAGQAPWLSRHATGPSLIHCVLSDCRRFIGRLHSQLVSYRLSALCLRT